MKQTTNDPDVLVVALELLENGYTPLPMIMPQKHPPFKWKCWQKSRPTQEDVTRWFDNAYSALAVVCGDLVMVDVDVPEKLARVQNLAGETPAICRTPRGYHLHYRASGNVFLKNRVQIKGQPIDLRCHGGLAIMPPTDGYEWIAATLPALNKLPIFQAKWLQSGNVKKPKPLIFPDDDSGKRIMRARAYIACIEGSISGQRGHDRCMRVAGILIQKFRLTIDEALPIFCEWNLTCEPPFTGKELLHKLEDAVANYDQFADQCARR